MNSDDFLMPLLDYAEKPPSENRDGTEDRDHAEEESLRQYHGTLSSMAFTRNPV